MAETKLHNQALDPTTRLASKVKAFTRDMAAASGDVSYTGVGFQPSAIIAFSNWTTARSWGMVDSAKVHAVIDYFVDGGTTTDNINLIGLASAGESNYQIALVKSFDADGFTLTWTKLGSPTGTADIKFICFR